MIKFIVVLALIATTASSQQVVRVTPAGADYRELTAEQAAELQQERVAREARESEAEQEPARFDAGIISQLIYQDAIDGSNGWAVAVTSAGELITTQWHGSPTNLRAVILRELKEQAKRRKAARDAKGKALGELGKGQLLQRVEAIEAYMRAEAEK